MIRPTLVVGACLFAALSIVGATRIAIAQTPSTAAYPSALVRIIVPYPPGGGTDIFARLLAQKLNERFGQPVVVDNRGGANGTIGTAVVAKAPADGYMLLMTSASTAANPFIYKNLPFDQARDLAPVSHLASGPMVLVVHPSLPAKSVKELVALAKARPGEINVGSAGIGSIAHLSAELFNLTSGAKLTHIPYRGSGPAIIDVMSGQISVYFMNILQSLSPIKAGKLRALGVTSPRRSPIAPDLPAIAEAGLPNYDMTNWYGLFAPAATPRGIIGRLQQEMTRILNLPELKERLAADGMTVVASTPEQFADFLNRENVKYDRVVRAAGISSSQ